MRVAVARNEPVLPSPRKYLGVLVGLGVPRPTLQACQVLSRNPIA
jgi:hypothetical protein